MKLSDLLTEITPLPWCFAEADNDKVIPTVRLFGRRNHDPSKEICFGRIDTVHDAQYICHAANALPELAAALHLLLEDQKRARPELSRGQFEFCESVLTKVKAIESHQWDRSLAHCATPTQKGIL